MRCSSCDPLPLLSPGHPVPPPAFDGNAEKPHPWRAERVESRAEACRELHGDRHRRRGARRRPAHGARRRAHARVHAGGDEGDRQGPRPGAAARARDDDPPRQHVPPALPARRGADRGARRPAPVHGLGRADPHGLRGLPGLLAPRHDRRRRRRGRDVQVGLRRRGRALHAGARSRDPAAARLGHRHVPRHLPSGRRPRPEKCSRPPIAPRSGPHVSSRRRARTGSSSSGSPRAARTSTSAAAPSTRSRPSASTATRSAG